MALDVKRRHLLYEEWRENTEFLWRSYLGGRAYHDYDDPPFLDQYPSEKSFEYEARRKRAFLLNYFAGTVDAYVAAVFRRDPVREPGENGGSLSSGVQVFLDDATGDGTDLNEFARDVATFALAAERAFVGVDIATSGLPYAHIIHPHNLLDFSEDEDGFLRWAIVAEEATFDEDPFEERRVEKRFRLWTPTQWQLFDEKGNPVDEGQNEAGRVPIVGVPGSSVRLPTYDIARINKRIYNYTSQLDEISYHATFPTLYYSGGDGVVDEDGNSTTSGAPLTLGPARALELPSDKDLTVIPPGYLAPPDGPSRVLMDERQVAVDAIRSLAGLERKDPDALSPQSGVAKAYDFRETNERFVSLAQVMEEFEMEVLDILAGYGVAGEVNVTYNKDFQVRDFQMLTDTYEKLQNFKLPVVVKKRAALDYSMAIAEEATEDEKREIREAVENMTEFDPVDPALAQPNGLQGNVTPLQPRRNRVAEILGTQPNVANEQPQTEGS